MILRIAKLLDGEALQKVLDGLKNVEFVDGKATASGAAARAKYNLQARVGEPQTRELQKLIAETLMKNEPFSNYAVPLQITPPLLSRYDEGMGYGDHIDRPVMQGKRPVRTDLAFTVFLSEPESYDGGELVVSSDFGPSKVKLGLGDAVLYPASTLHRVETVTRGSRFAAVGWVQSMIREHERRQLLAELAGVRAWIGQQAPDSKHGLQLQKIRAQLMRWWSDT